MTDMLTAEQINIIVRRIGDRELVATATNVKDPSTIDLWIDGELTPTTEQARRLLFIRKWSDKITSDPTYRLWLVAPVSLPNRPRGARTPVVEAIGQGAFDAVDSVARYIYHRTPETFGE